MTATGRLRLKSMLHSEAHGGAIGSSSHELRWREEDAWHRSTARGATLSSTTTS